MHGKHIAREAYLESPQKYMMELFCESSTKLFWQKNFIIDVSNVSKYASELQR